MVKLLKASEIDPANEAVDVQLSQAEEEAAARKQFAPTGTPGDLADGGMVNGVRLTPFQDGSPQGQGRPVARLAWMWNGTQSLLPLAYDPSGKTHDGGRKYLLKRACLCCNAAGFRGVTCPNCVKSHCTRCGGRPDAKKVISCFYLRKEDVPYPAKFYGSIPCFLAFCVRRDDRGFKTEEEMRMHARSRHRMEYQAHQETLTALRNDEVATLRSRLDAMTVAMTNGAAGAAHVAAVHEVISRPAKRSHKRRWTEEQKEAARARYKTAQEPVTAGAAT